MFRLMRILVDIPALDRLITYLEGVQQADIDRLNAEVVALTNQLQTHRLSLEGNIQTQQEKH